jgi:hypothetical protein
VGTDAHQKAQGFDLKMKAEQPSCSAFSFAGYGVEIPGDVVYNSIGLVSFAEGSHKIWIKVVQ